MTLEEIAKFDELRERARKIVDEKLVEGSKIRRLAEVQQRGPGVPVSDEDMRLATEVLGDSIARSARKEQVVLDLWELFFAPMQADDDRCRQDTQVLQAAAQKQPARKVVLQ